MRPADAIPDAPVYIATMAEMDNLEELLARANEVAMRYGAVRIDPPEAWAQPPLRMGPKSRFFVRMQTLPAAPFVDPEFLFQANASKQQPRKRARRKAPILCDADSDEPILVALDPKTVSRDRAARAASRSQRNGNQRNLADHLAKADFSRETTAIPPIRELPPIPACTPVASASPQQIALDPKPLLKTEKQSSVRLAKHQMSTCSSAPSAPASQFQLKDSWPGQSQAAREAALCVTAAFTGAAKAGSATNATAIPPCPFSQQIAREHVALRTAEDDSRFPQIAGSPEAESKQGNVKGNDTHCRSIEKHTGNTWELPGQDEGSSKVGLRSNDAKPDSNVPISAKPQHYMGKPSTVNGMRSTSGSNVVESPRKNIKRDEGTTALCSRQAMKIARLESCKSIIPVTNSPRREENDGLRKKDNEIGYSPSATGSVTFHESKKMTPISVHCKPSVHPCLRSSPQRIDRVSEPQVNPISGAKVSALHASSCQEEKHYHSRGSVLATKKLRSEAFALPSHIPRQLAEMRHETVVHREHKTTHISSAELAETTRPQRPLGREERPRFEDLHNITTAEPLLYSSQPDLVQKSESIERHTPVGKQGEIQQLARAFSHKKGPVQQRRLELHDQPVSQPVWISRSYQTGPSKVCSKTNTAVTTQNLKNESSVLPSSSKRVSETSAPSCLGGYESHSYQAKGSSKDLAVRVSAVPSASPTRPNVNTEPCGKTSLIETSCGMAKVLRLDRKCSVQAVRDILEEVFVLATAAVDTDNARNLKAGALTGAENNHTFQPFGGLRAPLNNEDSHLHKADIQTTGSLLRVLPHCSSSLKKEIQAECAAKPNTELFVNNSIPGNVQSTNNGAFMNSYPQLVQGLPKREKSSLERVAVRASTDRPSVSIQGTETSLVPRTEQQSLLDADPSVRGSYGLNLVPERKCVRVSSRTDQALPTALRERREEKSLTAPGTLRFRESGSERKELIMKIAGSNAADASEPFNLPRQWRANAGGEDQKSAARDARDGFNATIAIEDVKMEYGAVGNPPPTDSILKPNNEESVRNVEFSTMHRVYTSANPWVLSGRDISKHTASPLASSPPMKQVDAKVNPSAIPFSNPRAHIRRAELAVGVGKQDLGIETAVSTRQSALAKMTVVEIPPVLESETVVGDITEWQTAEQKRTGRGKEQGEKHSFAGGMSAGDLARPNATDTFSKSGQNQPVLHQGRHNPHATHLRESTMKAEEDEVLIIAEKRVAPAKRRRSWEVSNLGSVTAVDGSVVPVAESKECSSYMNPPAKGNVKRRIDNRYQFEQDTSGRLTKAIVFPDSRTPISLATYERKAQEHNEETRVALGHSYKSDPSPLKSQHFIPKDNMQDVDMLEVEFWKAMTMGICGKPITVAYGVDVEAEGAFDSAEMSYVEWYGTNPSVPGQKNRKKGGSRKQRGAKTMRRPRSCENLPNRTTDRDLVSHFRDQHNDADDEMEYGESKHHSSDPVQVSHKEKKLYTPESKCPKKQSGPRNHVGTLNRNGLLRHMPRMPGINHSMYYVGQLFTRFCWHTEDAFLNSVSYLHPGSAEKVWYAVPPRYATAFENYAVGNVFSPNLLQDESTGKVLLMNKTTMFDPRRVRRKGVEVYRVVHKPGSFVLTAPRAYHAGFNCGFNIAEAVNFASPTWFPVGREASSFARKSLRPLCVPWEYLLFHEAKAMHDMLQRRKSKLDSTFRAVQTALVVAKELKEILMNGEEKIRKYAEARNCRVSMLHEVNGLAKNNQVGPEFGNGAGMVCSLCAHTCHFYAEMCGSCDDSFEARCVDHFGKGHQLCLNKDHKTILVRRHDPVLLLDMLGCLEKMAAIEVSPAEQARRYLGYLRTWQTPMKSTGLRLRLDLKAAASRLPPKVSRDKGHRDKATRDKSRDKRRKIRKPRGMFSHAETRSGHGMFPQVKGLGSVEVVSSSNLQLETQHEGKDHLERGADMTKKIPRLQ